MKGNLSQENFEGEIVRGLFHQWLLFRLDSKELRRNTVRELVTKC